MWNKLAEGLTGHQNNISPQIVLSPSISPNDISILWAFKQPMVDRNHMLEFSGTVCMYSMDNNKWLLILLALHWFVPCLLPLYTAVLRWAQCEYSWYATVGQRDLAAAEPEQRVSGQDRLVPNDFLYCAQQIRSTLVQFVSVWHSDVQIILKGDGSIGRFK